ncbi:putative coiled-coil domain-containing protein 196 [Orycteropus afer afer]|uniref:Coiled-coil domain-containing protein 196 n=1 Tax=Orycteropus afer afer TaxID=1230840 RepID=A0A8B7A2Y1_ORYAF|nr:putative coiled-coil domain-containing protein 196 [Orycteropus afer afer]
MMNGANFFGSHLPSKTRSSKVDDNYLKELNEDLKLRKQELVEMLKPLENKNNLLFQKLMFNLEEKQRSLQIMRQIMAGKEADESSVVELIREAEEMKQNLEKKNKMLRKEMEMLWNKTFETEETGDQQKIPQIKNKADLQDGKASKSPSSYRKTRTDLEISQTEKVKEIREEKQQRKMEWVRYQEQANLLQNDFHGKVIELRIEALKNYQKANDLKLSLYLEQNFKPKQAFLNLPRYPGTMGSATTGRATTVKNERNVRNLESKTNTEQQGAKGSQFDDVGGRLFLLRSLPDEALNFEWAPEQEKDLQYVQATVQAALPLGPYDPADSMVLEVSVAEMLFGVFVKPPTDHDGEAQDHKTMGQPGEEKPDIFTQKALPRTLKLCL